MLDTLTQKIKRARDLESLCDVLNELFDTSKAILRENELTVAQAVEIIGYITQIRSLLFELQACRGGKGADEILSLKIDLLNKCYFELEGVVKEIRNDNLAAQCWENSCPAHLMPRSS